MYKFNIFTIGVYGSTEETYYNALKEANIDTFCDIRQRRGVRGSQYRYVNSNYLQNKLSEMDIAYHYIKDLAPTNDIRQKQKAEDKLHNIDKKSRTELGLVFKSEYIKQVLDSFDIDGLLHKLEESGAHNIVLFCVEQHPKACHRSLVAARLSNTYNLPIKHLLL